MALAKVHRSLMQLVFAGLLVATAIPAIAAAEATRINADNIASLQRGGPSAIAGIGDWWLSNGRICAAISGLNHDAGIVAGGGNLVDLSHCALRNDQWLNNNVIAGLSKDDALQAQNIKAIQEGDTAAIVVSSSGNGLTQEIRYSLAPDSDRLSIVVTLRRISAGPKIRMSAMITLHPSGSLFAFSQHSGKTVKSGGPPLPSVDNNSMFALLSAMSDADTSILLGHDRASAGISYRLRLKQAQLIDAKGKSSTLPRFQLNVSDYSLQGWLSRPPWIGNSEPGLLTFGQAMLMDINEGERVVARFEIDLSRGLTVADFNDKTLTGGVLQGTAAAGTAITLYSDTGNAINHTFADTSGRFRMAVSEAETFDLLADSPHGTITRHRIPATHPLTEFAIDDPGMGTLRLPQGQPMRLTVLSENGPPHPNLRSKGRLLTIKGTPLIDDLPRNVMALAGITGDATELRLPPGNYRLLASRGPSYTVTESRIQLSAGETRDTEITAPVLAVADDGSVAVDLHVHSSISFDSSVLRDEQMRRFAAEGGDVLVFTEHNRIDAIPDAQGWPLQVVNGVEYTSTARTSQAPYTIGHSNAFPVTFDPLAHRGGMPRVESSRLRDLIARTGTHYPGALFQLNHPRSPHPNDADLAFFSHLSSGFNFDPSINLDSGENRRLLEPSEDGSRDIDFDLLEVLNGSNIAVYEQVREDWFSLLKQGYRRSGTANADSHGWQETLGIPVNRVFLDKRHLPLKESDLFDALLAGRFYASNGPRLSVELETADGAVHGPGATLAGDSALLRVSVAHPDWINIDTLRVFVDGDLHSEHSHASASPLQLPLKFAADSFVVVEVRGTAGDIYKTLYPGHSPLAFSNPVYVDADGDGNWKSL